MKTLFMWGFDLILHFSFALFIRQFLCGIQNVDNQKNMASRYVNNIFLAVTHFIPE